MPVNSRAPSDCRKSTLLEYFRLLHSKPPDWAWPYAPSIPLIGEAFRPHEGLLIYASAENLSWMNHEAVPERFIGDSVWDRYRAAYEEIGQESGEFYPDVGIAPVSNGGLLVAAHYVMHQLGLPVDASPREFLERLAVTNWAKFTVRGKVNEDYIDDPKRPIDSLPYVIAELNTLRPAIVLIPKAIWRHPIHSAAMRGASPATRFIPVPQFNAQVVNCHLNIYDQKASALKRELANTDIARWMAELKNMNQSHAWRYLAYLDGLLGDHKGPETPV